MLHVLLNERGEVREAVGDLLLGGEHHAGDRQAVEGFGVDVEQSGCLRLGDEREAVALLCEDGRDDLGAGGLDQLVKLGIG